MLQSVVVRLSFLAIALGDFAGAWSTNGYLAYSGRLNPARSAVFGGLCSKPGGCTKPWAFSISAVAATDVDPVVLDKLSKWERKAQLHFSLPQKSSRIDLQQVRL
jgi:hypothetical protein